MNPDNEAVLNAIQGTGAQTPDTILSTGLASANMPSNNLSGMSQQNAPTTPNYMNTGAQFFGGQQPFNPLQQMYQPIIRHGIGRDNWSSNMGLDQQAILNSIGLGGQ